jgi:hypothetical protein
LGALSGNIGQPSFYHSDVDVDVGIEHALEPLHRGHSGNTSNIPI